MRYFRLHERLTKTSLTAANRVWVSLNAKVTHLCRYYLRSLLYFQYDEVFLHLILNVFSYKLELH